MSFAHFVGLNPFPCFGLAVHRQTVEALARSSELLWRIIPSALKDAGLFEREQDWIQVPTWNPGLACQFGARQVRPSVRE
jgi:hypothetical protein